MFASFFILASFVIEQLTPKWLIKVQDISRDVVFVLEEARLCPDFVRNVTDKKPHLKRNLVKGVNLIPPSSFSKQKPYESFV